MIQDKPYEEYTREVDERTLGNKDMHYKRKQVAEHPFGTIKSAMGFSYFLTRGNANVRPESIMHFFAYNLKRVINILGTKSLIEVL